MYPSSNAMPYGFRIVGNCLNDRLPTESWRSVFLACAQCDERLKLHGEAYLSAFAFGDAFLHHFNATGSTKGYRGECWSSWLWFDIDRENVDNATHDARRLAAAMVDRFGIVGDDLLAFYSGGKGFHFGVPTSLWNPTPSTSFPAYCRSMAERIAASAGMVIDVGIYDTVRILRAPNSRHGKTGRYKRWLSFDELMSLKPSRILELATLPETFEIPEPPKVDAVAVQWWQDAVAMVEQQRVPTSQRVQNRMQGGVESLKLNRSTLEFIREGAATGDRHRLLFSAAANLAEFDFSFEQAWLLLSEPALDSGLSPTEVRRQIRCGLDHKGQA